MEKVYNTFRLWSTACAAQLKEGSIRSSLSLDEGDQTGAEDAIKFHLHFALKYSRIVQKRRSVPSLL